MDGFVNLLKPPGMTSSDAVVWMRRMLGEKHIGHAGTLDPNAAGVLPLCVGRAARLFDFLLEKEKVYLAEVQLGVETDTCDAQGVPVARGDASEVTQGDVDAALAVFAGEIEQIPPVYAAVKVGGKRLYQAARAGEDIRPPVRRVTVYSARRCSFVENGRFLMRVACGKGTYIRAICRDVGRALGCFATMSVLVREQAGPFAIADAVLVEDVLAAAERGHAASLLLPTDWPLMELERVDIPGEYRVRALNGNPLPASACGAREGMLCRAYADGGLVFLGRAEKGVLRPVVMLGGGER